jgi:hypothetical protein
MDKQLPRIVTVSLALVTLVGLCLLGLLSWQEKPIPDALFGLPVAALGGLTGFLVGAGRTTLPSEASASNTTELEQGDLP